jgi:HK97 gp10 family phage protein
LAGLAGPGRSYAMTVKILNKDRLIRKLRAFPPRAEAAIRKAMEDSAARIVAMMRSLAPVDTGDLQMSISWTWGDAPAGSLKIGQIKSAAGNMRITIYAGGGDAWHARFIEFGTQPFISGGKFAGAANPGVRAQPFFYVSFRALRRSTKSRLSRAITKSAKEIAANG